MFFNEIKNYRFPLWLTVFLLLLISIPFFIFQENYALAKISGIILVCSITIALRYWFSVAKNRNNVVARVILNKNDLFDLERDFKPFINYDNESKKVVINRIGILLSKVRFIGTDDLHLDRRESIQLAFIYICENWTTDFIVNSKWVFKLSGVTAVNDSEFEYLLSIDGLRQKMDNIKLPNI